MILQGTLIAALFTGLLLAVVATALVLQTMLTLLVPAFHARKRMLVSSATAPVLVAGVVASDILVNSAPVAWTFVYLKAVMGAAVVSVAYLVLRRFN